MDTINILYTIQHFSQLFGKPSEMPLEQFNNLLGLAQDELFNEFAFGYMSGNGAEVDDRVASALTPFREIQAYTTGTSSSTLGVTSRLFQLNSNIAIVGDLWAFDNAEAYPDKLTRIDRITYQELTERLSNSITYPSLKYPVAVMNRPSTQYQCYIIPDTITSIRASVLNKPTTPSLVLQITDGVQVVNASASTSIQFYSTFHIDIIRIMLKFIGIIVGNQQIQQYVEQEKTLEK